MKLTNIFLTIAITLIFGGCFGKNESKEQWTSFIYPDINNTKRSKEHGIYNTLEECKKASTLELINLGLKDRGDYKCGLNCEYHEGMKSDICEKLTK